MGADGHAGQVVPVIQHVRTVTQFLINIIDIQLDNLFFTANISIANTFRQQEFPLSITADSLLKLRCSIRARMPFQPSRPHVIAMVFRSHSQIVIPDKGFMHHLVSEGGEGLLPTTLS